MFSIQRANIMELQWYIITIEDSNKKKKIASVVGARPNFIKLALTRKSIIKSSSDHSIDHTILNTGQHYDYNLSKIFLKNLGYQNPILI